MSEQTWQDVLELALKSYHVENSRSGWQRLLGLVAEPPQALHTYVGSLDKDFSSLDFESRGHSQIFLVDLLREFFLSVIMRLACSQQIS